MPELDRVLGGGLVPGAAILLAGEPGVGKSTLLLEVAAQTARVPAAHPLRHRRGVGRPRSGCAPTAPAASTTSSTSPPRPTSARCSPTSRRSGPTLLVVDSVQTIGASGVDGVPGGVTQVKEVAAALIRVAKTRNITTVLVGHVTKDGSIAGPRVLEHLVDVVLHFEGDRNSRFRMVRAMKNRFGPVDEVGCFDLGPDGITAVTDPTGLFVEHQTGQVPGTCVAVTMEGRRPLLAEVQALVTPVAARAAAAYDVRARLLAGRDGARRAPAALRDPAAHLRRLRLDRRRRPAAPSRPATSPSPSRIGSATLGVAPPSGRGRDGRDRPGRRAAPGARPAAAAGRGRPARLPLAVAPVTRASERDPRDRPGQSVDGMPVLEASDLAAALHRLGVTGSARRAAS